MQKITALALLCVLSACGGPSKSDDTLASMDSSDVINSDSSLYSVHDNQQQLTTDNDTFEIEDNPRLFILGFRTIYDTNRIGFVSLTDRYPFHPHPDSSIISEEMRKEPSGVKYNHHVIGSDKRALFLKNLSIQEDDQLFAFDFQHDTVVTFPVSELKLVGSLSPYISERDFPVPEYYFQIGFEIPYEPVRMMHRYSYHEIIYIGKANPFKVGEATPILFEEISFENYLKEDQEQKDTTGKYKYLRFSHNGYDFYTKVFAGQYYFARKMRVFHRSSGQKVLDREYGRGEGASASIIRTPAMDIIREPYLQWTGGIFRGKPPVIIGMEYQSFGCEPVDFLDPAIPRIYFWCDNRH